MRGKILLMFLIGVLFSSTVYADYTIGTVNYRDRFVFESGKFDCNAINYQTGKLIVLANQDEINRANTDGRLGWVTVCIEGEGTDSKCYSASDFKRSDRILLGFPAVDNTYSGQCNATYKAGFVNPMVYNSPNWNSVEKVFDIYSNQRICAQKFVCVTQSNSAYQKMDCSYSNETSCVKTCNQGNGLCDVEVIIQKNIVEQFIDWILNLFRGLKL